MPDTALDDGDDGVVTLTAGDAVVTVHPGDGGRIGQITIADVELLIAVPDPTVRPPIAWGSFPMAPWVGRIRAGHFEFDGVRHQLAINHHDDGDDDGDARRAHSIHGTVFERPWSVTGREVRSVVMRCPLAGGLDWPFGGVARQHIEIHPDRLVQTLAVETDVGRFPAVIGWHPWFRTPDHLDFAPTAMYRRDAYGVPTGELIAPVDGPWDDCFLNSAPVRLRYGRDIAPTVTVDADCDHWVVFDELSGATCVEPQSGPPDAFNLVDPSDSHPLARVVTPDAPLQRTMTISW